MTSLRKLSFQVMRILSNGPLPKDSKLSEVYIQTELRQVTNKLLKIEYYKALNAGDKDVPPQCVGTYTVSVTKHADGRNYATLPAQPMTLPSGFGNIGIQQIRPLSDNPDVNRAMIPIMPNEAEIFRSLLINDEILKDQWTFEPDRDKVWFSERNNNTLLEDNITQVEMKICVVDPAQIDEEANLPIPPDMEIDLIKEVLVLHGYQPNVAADMINDDNPNTK